MWPHQLFKKLEKIRNVLKIFGEMRNIFKSFAYLSSVWLQLRQNPIQNISYDDVN